MKSVSGIGGVSLELAPLAVDDAAAEPLGVPVVDGVEPVPVDASLVVTGVDCRRLCSVVDATAGESASPCDPRMVPMITSPAGGGGVAADDPLSCGLAQR